jgi:polyhydroxyalkanoate synthase
MKTENKIDPKLVEEFLKFSRNVVEAPKMVSAPDEINLEVTPHDVVYTEDKVRLLHYKPLTTKINQSLSYFRYSSKEELGQKSIRTRY